MSRKSALLGAAMLACASPAFGQETTDAHQETVTVTGLRAVRAQDVTASVTVIDADELAIRDAPFLADVLRAAPATGVSRSGALGGLTQVRIRGAEANHTLVLIDGIEASDPTTGETDFGLWSGLDIARIEVARGEQSALYGSDAIGGVIEVSTGTLGLQAAAETGSFATTRGMISYGAESERAALGFALSGFTTDGVDTSGTGGEKDGSDNASLIVRGGVSLGDDWSLRGLARYGESTVAFDTDLDFDGALDNADLETESEQVLVGASLSGGTGRVSHLARASYSEVTRDNFADGAFTDSTTGQRTKLSYSPSILFGTAGAPHTLSGLLEYENEDYERVSLDTAFGDPNQSQSFESIGIAGEYRFSSGPWAFNASARYDDNNGRFDDATTWRVGAARTFDFGGRVRASMGRGVKNPTFTELFGYYPGTFTGNPNLEPETSTSWEIGWDQTLFDTLNLKFTYFSAELQDEIYTIFNADFTSSPANRDGESVREGVELSAEWTPAAGVRVFGAASYVDSKNDTDADEIRVPNTTGSLAISWTPPQLDRFTGGLAFDYVGEQDDTDFGTFTQVTLESYVLVSVTAAYDVTDRLAITLRGENIFDEEPVDVFGSHQQGAGLFVGLRYK